MGALLRSTDEDHLRLRTAATTSSTPGRYASSSGALNGDRGERGAD
jgi:hypothetical protein